MEADGFLNCICPECGKMFHLKSSQANDGGTHCCSMGCANELRKKTMSGSNNHQFGLLGSLNASWIRDYKITNYGYKKIRKPDHPFKDTDGFVFEHRLVAEKYLLTEENSVEIDGARYLRKDYSVHHIDENKLNNDPHNLMVLRKGDHTSLHNRLMHLSRNSLGQFIPRQ